MNNKNSRYWMKRLLSRTISIWNLLCAAMISGGLFLLRPLIHIRFVEVPSQSFGDFCGWLDLFLYKRTLDDSPKNHLDLFHYSRVPRKAKNGKVVISNHQLHKMWKRQLHIYQWSYRIARLCSAYSFSKDHVIRMSFHYSYGWSVMFKETATPQVQFTKEEEEQGSSEMKRLHIPEDQPLVLFHARDAAYKQTLHKYKDWSYGEYRNNDINDYLPAAEQLANRGCFLVRMGALVEKSLEIEHPRIYDYASEGRSEFMDLYLTSQCHFVLGDGCGVTSMPQLLRKPIALVNAVPLQVLTGIAHTDICIFKRYWSISEKRFLKLKEILSQDTFYSIKTFEALGIEVIGNTAEEIIDVSLEMEQRLRGEWKSSEEDEALQERFWNHFHGLFFGGDPDLKRRFQAHYQGSWLQLAPRIGANFLRENIDLMD